MEDNNQSPPEPYYISVDIETAGPNPSQYSLLTVGACAVADLKNSFYVEIQPVNDKLTPESYAIHRLDIKRLAERGQPPAHAMANFEDWIKSALPDNHQAMLISLNAPATWMFVNDYFQRYLGRNPFGENALDIQAYYMGLTGASWAETSMKHLAQRYLNRGEITHHALRDALDQAEIFSKMLAEQDAS